MKSLRTLKRVLKQRRHFFPASPRLPRFLPVSRNPEESKNLRKKERNARNLPIVWRIDRFPKPEPDAQIAKRRHVTDAGFPRSETSSNVKDFLEIFSRDYHAFNHAAVNHKRQLILIIMGERRYM